MPRTIRNTTSTGPGIMRLKRASFSGIAMLVEKVFFFWRAVSIFSLGHLESAAPAWCKVGVGWVEESNAKGAFLLRTCAVALTFPPLVKGGLGGVGRKTSASSVCSPFARREVRKRHAFQADEAAQCAVDLIDRSISPSTPPSCARRSPARPPWPPLHKGGKEESSLAEFAQRIGKD